MKKLERKEMKAVKGGTNAAPTFCQGVGQACGGRVKCCSGLLCDACSGGSCTCAA